MIDCLASGIVRIVVSTVLWAMWLLLPLTVLFDQLFPATQPNSWHIVWPTVAYELVVIQGIAVLQPLTMQSLQDIWFLRLLLSQSFFGALLLLGLTLKQRVQPAGSVSSMKT